MRWDLGGRKERATTRLRPRKSAHGVVLRYVFSTTVSTSRNSECVEDRPGFALDLLIVCVLDLDFKGVQLLLGGKAGGVMRMEERPTPEPDTHAHQLSMVNYPPPLTTAFSMVNRGLTATSIPNTLPLVLRNCSHPPPPTTNW